MQCAKKTNNCASQMSFHDILQLGKYTTHAFRLFLTMNNLSTIQIVQKNKAP